MYTKPNDVQPFVEGEARSNAEYLSLIDPRDLVIEKLHPPHKFLNQLIRLGFSFEIRVNDCNQFIVCEKREIFYYFMLYLPQDFDLIVVVLFDVVGIVHDHLDKTWKRDLVKVTQKNCLEDLEERRLLLIFLLCLYLFAF